MSAVPTEVTVALLEHCLELLAAITEERDDALDLVDRLAPKARAWEEVYELAKKDEAADIQKLDGIWAVSQVDKDQDGPDP